MFLVEKWNNECKSQPDILYIFKYPAENNKYSVCYILTDSDGLTKKCTKPKPPSPTATMWLRAKASIIIRNVIALLLLKDRGQGKKDQAQRYKVRAEH